MPDSKYSNLKKSSLILLLKSLSKEEMRQFDKFVRSPFHNNRSEVTRYFQQLKKYYPAFDHKDFNKEKLYHRLYPATGYKDDVMRRLGTNLKSLIENFLSYKLFFGDSFERNLSLSAIYFERNLDGLLEKKLNECEIALGSFPCFNSKYFYDMYRLQTEKHNFFDSRRRSDLMYQNHSDQFDNLIYYYLSSLFFLLCVNSIYNSRRKNTKEFNSTIQSAFMKSFSPEKLINDIKEKPVKENVLALAYYYLYCALKTPDDETVQANIIDLLNNHSDKIDRTHTYNINTALMGVYGRNVINGNLSYFRKEFELYKIIISKNYLVPDDSMYIDLLDFINIVDIAVYLKEIKWAESFLEEYMPKAHPADRDNIFNYCNANIAYFMKEYDKSIRMLMKVNFDAELKYSTKFLLCKIYYDMDLTEQLYSLIDSFRHYLNNEKQLPDNIREKNMGFLLYLKKLSKFKIENDKKSLPLIRKEVQFGSPAGKNWLIEKIDELINI